MAERDCFVRFDDVATGNFLIDGTNYFFRALVFCGAPTTFAGFDFLFCIVFGIESLAVAFVLTAIGCLMGADVVIGINCLHEKGRFSTSCAVNVVHAFGRGMCNVSNLV